MRHMDPFSLLAAGATPLPPDYSAEAMTRRLTDACFSNDIDDARRVFEISFWQHVEVKPDWLHLYLAASHGNRPFVQLMIARGAAWSAEEASALLPMLGKSAEPFRGLLKNAGIPYEAVESVDPLAAHLVRRRILNEAEARGIKLEILAAETEEDISRAMIAAAIAADARRIHEISALRKPYTGIPGMPVDREVDLILSEPNAATHIAAFLEGMVSAGVRIKPFSFTKLQGRPDTDDIIHVLVTRGMTTREDRADLRRAFLDMLGYGVKNPASNFFTPCNMQEAADRYPKTIALLFSDTAAMTPDEAADFAERYRRANINWDKKRRYLPEERLTMPLYFNTGLLQTKFFGNPAFTASHLRKMRDAESAQGMAMRFDALAVKKDITEKGLGAMLQEKGADHAEIARALSGKIYTPPATDVSEVLACLKKAIDKGGGEHAMTLVTAMRDAGGDFSEIDPMDYLGKKKPGVAKILLDLGIVEPENFQAHSILRRIILTEFFSLKTLFNEAGSGLRGPYNSFFCQLLLETHDPGRFKPLRGKNGVNYPALVATAHLDDKPVRYKFVRRGQKSSP